MSDMKTEPPLKKTVTRRTAASKPAGRTFTVRDLNREPQAVLNAARKMGGVHVRSRSGERFIVRLDPEEKPGLSEVEYRRAFHARLKELHARMRKEGSWGITAEGCDTFSKMIAGEA